MITQRTKTEQRQDVLIRFGKEYGFTKEQLLAKKILPALVYEKDIDNGYNYYFSALDKLDSLDEKYLVHNDPSKVQQKQNTLIRFGKEYNFTKEQLLAKKILPALVYEKGIDNGYNYYFSALDKLDSGSDTTVTGTLDDDSATNVDNEVEKIQEQLNGNDEDSPTKMPTSVPTDSPEETSVRTVTVTSDPTTATGKDFAPWVEERKSKKCPQQGTTLFKASPTEAGKGRVVNICKAPYTEEKTNTDVLYLLDNNTLFPEDVCYELVKDHEKVIKMCRIISAPLEVCVDRERSFELFKQHDSIKYTELSGDLENLAIGAECYST